MGGVSAAEILSAWERGAAQSWAGRGVTLLNVWPPSQVTEECAKLSIGACDAWLWQVRTMLFGSRLACFVECPSCAAPLQFELDARQVAQHVADSDLFSRELDVAGFHVRFRALTIGDVLDTERLADVAVIRRSLIERVILTSHRGDDRVDVSELPLEVIDAVGRRLAEGDGAELLLDFRCADCEHAWQDPFDIVSFLWTEVARSAKHILHEVHILAWAYGWSEKDILSMSPARRRLYLEWVS